MTGFAMDAINVVRGNRFLLKKRKFKEIKSLILEVSGKTGLTFKEVSPEELTSIKDQIRAKAKKEAKQEIAIYCICIILTLGFFYWLFFM